MKNAIQPGSFDPMTYGHMDITERILPFCEKLVMAIGVNPNKAGQHTFSLQERMQLIRQIYADKDNVDVVAFRGMLTDYCYENQLNPIIRGQRNSKDFDEQKEFQMAMDRQGLGIETIFLNASRDKEDISSSFVKGVLKEQGDKIREYVPLNVKQALEGRMLGQYTVGLTGTIGSGKSYATAKFMEIAKKNGIPVHNLDMDKIAKDIQTILPETEYQAVRGRIADTFGSHVQDTDGSIIHSELGKIVFADPQKMKLLNELMATPIRVRLRREMLNKNGILFYNAALVAEANKSYIPNNNIILMDIDPETQAQRLKNRGHDESEIARRVSSQFSTQAKADIFEATIAKDKWGSLMKVDGKSTDSDFEQAFNYMLTKVDTFGELRFAGLMNRLGVKEDPKKLFAQLRDMYDRLGDGSGDRDEIKEKMKGSYHKWLHAIDCSNELYEVKHLLDDPDVVECALLFHDAIYDPTSHTNEEDSAALAEKMLTQRGVAKDFIEKVKKLILATKHIDTPTDNDTKYMMDIDMAILGKNPRIYKQYGQDVRREYYMYDDATYKQGRDKFLDGIISKKNVYHTEYFHDKYQKQLETNVLQEIMSSKKAS
ncbi:MAG: pantetheine-phosphate adenylyltransferase [candidate division SR1 bacterium]|nr:pantetheine-phosphate adenylyltransferase [candidate division SR1 bacterium]